MRLCGTNRKQVKRFKSKYMVIIVSLNELSAPFKLQS